MERNTNFLSELELELEADFDTNTQGRTNSETNDEFELDSESDNEFELDSEADNELELDSETDNEFETDSEYDNELELESDNEFEGDYSGTRNYESRLSQLLSRGSDSELEFDQELNQVIHEMEQEFFFKGLKKWARKGLRKFKSIAGRTPLGQVINTASSLARGNIRNALRRAASLALSHGAGFIPGGAVLSPIAAKALNLETSADQEASFKQAKNLVNLARHSYKNLASQIDPRMADARTAKSMAQQAINRAFSAIRQNGYGTQGRSNRVVVHVSQSTWNKVKNGGSLVIKVR